MNRSATTSAALTGLVLSVVLAAPAAAGKPDHTVIDVSDDAYEAQHERLLTAYCGFPVDVEGSGRLRETTFDREEGLVYLGRYATTVTFSGQGRSVTLHDVGPDRVVVRGGTTVLQQIGRSVTGSGTIGRTTIDLDTGEVLSRSGKDVWVVPDGICRALSPGWELPPPPDGEEP